MSSKSRIIVEYDGQVHTLNEWAEIVGISYNNLHHRYTKGHRGDMLLSNTRTLNCKICGKEFTTKIFSTKCCSEECKKINTRINCGTWNEKKRVAKPEETKEKKLTLTEIAVMAKEAGMSYGQYSAMLALRKEREANGKV